MLAGQRSEDNFNRKRGRKNKKFVSLSAAFDHYESRQMEILMELKLLETLASRKQESSVTGSFMRLEIALRAAFSR